MDQNIKQRLVGIAVIFALAVIFLPMILDGSGVDKKTLKVEIPEQPNFEARTDFDEKIIELQAKIDGMPELEPRYVDENTGHAENRIQRQDDKARGPVIAGVQAELQGEPKQNKSKKLSGSPVVGVSWVLQVGSYKDRKKALIQRDRLRKSKVAAVFIEQFNGDKQASFRVRLGPFLNRDQSKIAQNKIKAKFNIDGLIMKYEH